MRRFPFLVALGVIFGLALFSWPMLVETNNAGFFKVRQMPVTGELTWYTTPGMFPQLWGKVTTYKEAGTYRFNDEEDTDVSINSPAIEVRFNDAGKARIAGSTRFTLPGDHESLNVIHNKFRSYSSVASSLVQPTVEQAILLTASLMSAEESYSGRRAEFGQLVEDQIRHGIYLTEFRTETIKDSRTGDPITVRIVSIKRNSDGNPIRKGNPLHAYGVSVTQFFLDKDFTYEEGVLSQISNARESLMKTVAAKAAAERALQERITAEAEGQANVMKAQYEAEVVKVQAVVDAEREKAVAETMAAQNLEVAKLAKLQAEQYKLQQILIGEGDGERKRLVLEADGALEQKLATFERTQAMWAKAYATRPVPSVVWSGGGGNDGTNTSNTDLSTQTFIDLLNIKVAKDLALDRGIGSTGK